MVENRFFGRNEPSPFIGWFCTPFKSASSATARPEKFGTSQDILKLREEVNGLTVKSASHEAGVV
jgi:hypothetical protein